MRGGGGVGAKGGVLALASQCALAMLLSHHASHFSVFESEASLGAHGAPCTQKEQPRHLHASQWLCHSSMLHQSCGAWNQRKSLHLGAA